ncbi:NAD(P)-dependent alcohol dehydrogenase [Microbacterium paludicola]|uniref:NAD(P)-dependent alcohol dehydrogenase n=1 Tax=Microbacterium paludicola TaxID=300019 RepID=UPI0016428CF0|nr:NAD(P)-dependent alcohol dehydrogenase [Microbacterium paludicola]
MTIPTTMKAVQAETTGAADVLEVKTVEVPEVSDAQVLVRVHASSVNPADVLGRQMKLGKLPRGTGADYAGEVVLVGGKIAGLRTGDSVWGYLGGGVTGHLGAAAEYVAVTKEQIGRAPRGVDAVDTAALATTGLTALQSLRALRLRPGSKLLIVGASGGVGTAAIQLARALGVEVTAVASSANADYCRELGATHVVDYRDVGDITTAKFDALLDCHGGDLGRYLQAVRRGGRAVEIAAKGFGRALASWVSLRGPRVRIVIAKSSRADLEELAGKIEAGHLSAVVDEVFPLDQIVTAHRQVETGHARGKRVLDLRLALGPRDRA